MIHPLRQMILTAVMLNSSLGAQELRVTPRWTSDQQRMEVRIEGMRGSEAGRSLVKATDASALILKVDGKDICPAKEVISFWNASHGMAVVVAVDVSGSMAGAPLKAIQKAIQTLSKDFGPQDRVALVTFSDNVQTEVPLSPPSGDLLRSARTLSTRGKATELYRALFKSLEILDATGIPERRRLILITDGKDEGVGYTLEDVLAKAKGKGIAIDAIGISQVDPKYLSICERLSDLTGGVYVHVKEVEQLDAIIRKHVMNLQQTPVAVFLAPEGFPADGGIHKVAIRFQTSESVREGEASIRLALTPPKSWKERSWILVKNPKISGPVGGGLLALIIGLVLLKRRNNRIAREKAAAIADREAADELLRQAEERKAQALLEMEQVATGGVSSQSSATPRRERKTSFQSDFLCNAPASGRPALLLRAESGPVQGRVFAVELDPCWIGAESEATICISGDSYLSGFHAYLRFQGGMMYLFDNESSNGTFKNGHRLGSASVVVEPGDQIRMGKTEFLIMKP